MSVTNTEMLIYIVSCTKDFVNSKLAIGIYETYRTLTSQQYLNG